MKRIRRILVAVKNPRAPTLPAVAKAARLASAFGADIELFHSLSTPVFVDALGGGSADLVALERAQRAEAAEALEVVARRLRRHGLAVDVAVECDFPVHEAIVRRARRTHADLIVAERHGTTRHARWLLSYTDWELLRASPLPVLIVKSARLYRHPPVLAAVDPLHAHAKPAKLDEEILAAASLTSAALGSRLHVMHAVRRPAVLPFGAFGDGYPVAVPVATREIAEEARAALRRLLRTTRLRPGSRHLIEGDPIEAIPQVARATASGIVVMGAVSRSALGRAFIGNTAERVLDALEADVLVVKPARFAPKIGRSRRGLQLITAPPLP